MIEIERELGKPLKEAILELLNENDNLTLTADLMGIDRGNLRNWMGKLGIKGVISWEVE